MKKTDFKKEYAQLFTCPPAGIVEVHVPNLPFLMIDGKGDPATEREFAESVQALYTLSYTLKFQLKKANIADYVVAPLEGLWWSDDMGDYLSGKRSNWKWTLMILQPRPVTKTRLDEAREVVRGKGKDSSFVAATRLENFREGTAAQLLYLGPYRDEGPAIQRLHRFITSEKGKRLSGKHHEIYLGDPRKAAPERLKTIIRQPFV